MSKFIEIDSALEKHGELTIYSKPVFFTIILRSGLYHTKISEKEDIFYMFCEKQIWERFLAISMKLGRKWGSSPIAIGWVP